MADRNEEREGVEDSAAALERAVFEWAESVVRPVAVAVAAALADLPPEVRGAAVARVLADLPPPAVPDRAEPRERYVRSELERRPAPVISALLLHAPQVPERHV
jgi:hypothetical protein